MLEPERQFRPMRFLRLCWIFFRPEVWFLISGNMETLSFDRAGFLFAFQSKISPCLRTTICEILVFLRRFSLPSLRGLRQSSWFRFKFHFFCSCFQTAFC